MLFQRMLFPSDPIFTSMHLTCWKLNSRQTNLQRDLRSKLEAGVCVYLCVHVYQYECLCVHVHGGLVAPLSDQGRAPPPLAQRCMSKSARSHPSWK